MNILVQTAHGERVHLSASPLAQGGEAAVYEVPQYPNAVVKLYHPQVLAARQDTLRVKIAEDAIVLTMPARGSIRAAQDFADAVENDARRLTGDNVVDACRSSG